MRPNRGALARKLYTDTVIAPRPVRPRRRKRGWWGLALVGTGALSTLTMLVVLYLGFCTHIVERQYALDHLESLLPSLREQNANLDIQVRQLSKPSRIEQIARARLHMDVPKERIFIVENTEQRPGAEFAWKGLQERIASP